MSPTKHRAPAAKRLGAAVFAGLTLATCALGQPVTRLPTCKELIDKPVTVTGKRDSLPEENFPADEITATIPADASARYLRVRFAVDSPPRCEWYLTVRDSVYRVVQTFTPRNIRNPQSQWTVRIPGSVARFQLERCAGNSPVIKFKEYIWMPKEEKNSYYSVQDSRNKRLFPLYQSSSAVVPINVRPWGDFVGFMMSSWGKLNWTCSGVLVAPDLFLTNWHCGGPPTFDSDERYWSQQILNDTIIDFSWDGDDLSREYAVIGREAVNKDLDFAILKVRPIDSAEEARAVALSRRPVHGGDPVRIIHHPAAMEKRTGDCQVVDTPYQHRPADFTHRCDTEGGSSGAPMFDSAGNVVGLHHHGFEAEMRDSSCRYMDNLNKAVRMEKIIEFLEFKHGDLYKKLKVVN